MSAGKQHLQEVMEKLEIIPAATQVYLSKGRIADMVRAESGIFAVVEMGLEGELEVEWEDVHEALRNPNPIVYLIFPENELI